ncbi:hypothetical protein LguiA_008035 [Lonicera macranthoides]
MVEEEGKEMRRRAEELKKKAKQATEEEICNHLRFLEDQWTFTGMGDYTVLTITLTGRRYIVGLVTVLCVYRIKLHVYGSFFRM